MINKKELYEMDEIEREINSHGLGDENELIEGFSCIFGNMEFTKNCCLIFVFIFIIVFLFKKEIMKILK